MFFKAALFALIPAVLASPQVYGPAPGPAPAATTAPAPSPSTLATTNSNEILVTVSPSGAFTFSPSDITASVGTLVTFAFPGTIAHSVTEGSFSAPCTPLSGGFDSGLVSGTGETFSINVTDASNPIYFFCKFPEHCGLGMVGTINAPSGSANGSFSSYQAAAMAIGTSEPNIQDNGPVTGGVGAIATAGPTTGTPSVSGSAPTTSTSASSGGSSSGAAQLTINSVLALVGVAAGAALML